MIQVPGLRETTVLVSDEVFRVADNGLDRGFDSLQSLEESFLNKVTRHRYSIEDSE